MKKQVFATAGIASLALAITGCGADEEEPETNETPLEQETAPQDETDNGDDMMDDDGDTMDDDGLDEEDDYNEETDNPINQPPVIEQE